jgi:hypothetical protein
VFRFGVSVPKLDCYELFVGGTPVGLYPYSALEPDFNVGYIDSESASCDPESGEPAQAYMDFFWDRDGLRVITESCWALAWRSSRHHAEREDRGSLALDGSSRRSGSGALIA